MIDDFLFLAKAEGEQSSEYGTKALHLGVPIASETVIGPLLVLDFLGIILDSLKLELRLLSPSLLSITQLNIVEMVSLA